MTKNLNELPKIGETIMCLHMDGETSVPPGTIGVVKKIEKDPFEADDYLITVKWENGSSLALVTSVDAWKKVGDSKINEQADRTWKYMVENPDIFEHFDWRWLEQFLYKIRDSGVVNMFGAAPLLYGGREHIDRYYGEGKEDDEKFQEVLDDADESKNKIIQGVVNYMNANNKDLDNMSMVNNYARNFSNKIVGLYVALSGLRDQQR